MSNSDTDLVVKVNTWRPSITILREEDHNRSGSWGCRLRDIEGRKSYASVGYTARLYFYFTEQSPEVQIEVNWDHPIGKLINLHAPPGKMAEVDMKSIFGKEVALLCAQHGLIEVLLDKTYSAGFEKGRDNMQEDIRRVLGL